ncbi:MAG: hypothetical protein MRJ52_11020 [Nitrosomonas sp.]|nr:hypothetical protein [Nitrosomonas sp.]
MKKIMLMLCLMIMSASSFAIVNFSTSTGALVMRDVVVNDTRSLFIPCPMAVK